MRDRLPFPSHSSLKILWALAWISIQSTSAMYPKELIPTNVQLFQPCRSSFDCLIYISHSHCDWGQRVCTCQPYHVVYNNSMCLPASLLTYGCVLDSQCKMKVANSRCVNGLCECETGFMPLRKDKCLPPAKIGDYCLNDRQCLLASSYSFCKYIIPRVYGKCRCPLGYFVTPDGTCLPHLGSECQNSFDCEEVTPFSICEPSPSDNTAYCTCREGYKTSTNRLECEQLPQETAGIFLGVASLGRSCNSSQECRARDPYSACIQGVCDCVRENNECNARNTGCHPDSFQCRSSGYCISWYFVCDKQTNCPDNSDEDECVPYKCPPQAFQCDEGTCLSRSLVCNGRWECPDGSDEARCYRGIPCDKSAFRCRNGQCLPQYTFCNAVQDCADGSDENPDICNNKGGVCPQEHFQCRNGQCRSTAILCSGLDGCGDNSDETDCEACFCPKP